MLIKSLHNERIKQIRKLENRKWREQSGCYFVEGLHLVYEALDVGVDLENIVLCSGLADKHVIERIGRVADVPVIDVSADVFARLAEPNYSEGIAAVVRQKLEPLDRIIPGPELCWIAAGFIQCPANLGTLLRLSDSVGGGGIILVEDSNDPHHPTSDPFHPSAVRASLGAVFSQRIVRTGLLEFAGWKQKHGCHLVGTSPNATLDYRCVDFQRPLIIYLGNEWTGMSCLEQEVCDVLVKIPMAGRIPSHSVATAAGIVLYEIMNKIRPFDPHQILASTPPV